MHTSSRVLAGSRVWTIEAGWWRVSVRFPGFDVRRWVFNHDSRTAFSGGLPFVSFAAFRRHHD